MDEAKRTRKLTAIAVIDRQMARDHAQVRELMAGDENPNLLTIEIISAFTGILRGLLADRRQVVLAAYRAELVRR